jgi:hypothetical protein
MVVVGGTTTVEDPGVTGAPVTTTGRTGAAPDGGGALGGRPGVAKSCAVDKPKSTRTSLFTHPSLGQDDSARRPDVGKAELGLHFD